MDIKNQKGFIQIPILIAIIAGVLILGETGYFGIRQYQKYQTEKIEQKKLTELNQKNGEEQQKKLQKLLDSQSKELGKQKSEIETLKNKKPETITQTIIKEVPVQKTEKDLSSIIAQWRPIVAYIKCDFYSATGYGSCILMHWSNGDISVMTNKHVLTDESNNGPNVCYVSFPGSNNVYTIINTNTVSGNPIRGNTLGYDLGRLDIINPDNYIKSLVSSGFERCTGKASVGEEIIILGYPSIGSQSDITATRGIISGYDGDYYITDAKVEHGNSGGLAILVKDNCYLGIPSFATIGSVESLDRILDNKIVFPN